MCRSFNHRGLQAPLFPKKQWRAYSFKRASETQLCKNGSDTTRQLMQAPGTFGGRKPPSLCHTVKCPLSRWRWVQRLTFANQKLCSFFCSKMGEDTYLHITLSLITNGSWRPFWKHCMVDHTQLKRHVLRVKLCCGALQFIFKPK